MHAHHQLPSSKAFWRRREARSFGICALAASLAGCLQQAPEADGFAAATYSDVGADVGAWDASTGDGSSGDAFAADTSVADTFIADTSLADTSLADTSLADTFIADTSVADTSVADTSVADSTPADAGADAFGKPCKSATECGPAPSQCTSWQCTGLCYPLLANSGPCDDGDACTSGDVCFVGTCQAGGALGCDDGNACTLDTCTSPQGCGHIIQSDGSACGGGKSCNAGVCGGGVGGGVLQASAAEYATCAIVKGPSGKVFCWGDDAEYQAGSGQSKGKWFVLPEPVALQKVASQVATGGKHACALTDGGVYCWGDDQFGQSSGKGDGQKPGALAKTPQLVAVPAVELALGQYHSCARDTGGSVRCWGLGSSGQLGDGKGEVATPPVVVKLPGPASALSCGHSHCSALVGGVPYGWGFSQSGQLGTGSSAASVLPVAAKDVTGATAVAAGDDHTCVLLGGGQVNCWGGNSWGQAGDNGSSTKLTPGLIVGLSGVSAIAAGGGHTCAVQSGGLLCWGDNTKLQVAPQSKALLHKAPILVEGVTGVVGVALGGSHTCVRKGDGALWCWGGNNVGQIGNGSDKDVKTPFWVQ